MPQLASRLSPALLPLAPGPPLQAVAAWRFVAVVAILGHLHPQGLILGQQHRQLPAELGDQGFEFGNALL
jgi:hypothetical protein